MAVNPDLVDFAAGFLPGRNIVAYSENSPGLGGVEQ